MRVMMIVKATEDSEAGVLPTREQFAEMGKYNDELAKAGLLLAADGLRPSSEGARVVFAGGAPSVIDGPFSEIGELMAGYWVIRVDSMDAAFDWAKRIPFRDGVVELRRIYEESDFPAESAE
ncbi:YciI family protein [Streptomyces sp. AV19]|uniref:YciI family protein n=1 Tax=Streptomyces sp. AV19 TaxID=2793068 RepID=UPI0018FF07EF|nr:YciI family protein [Streptomyces sp. AV19]MBH1935756.1 YciI family protein [Streptomyces sp. AV19]MDG4535969.1 YciI family protein [Streptomyces sp. AV19]